MECARCGAVLDGKGKTCAACGAAVMRQEPLLDTQEVDRSLAEANLLRIRKRYEEAMSVCTRALRLDPSSATAHSLMGDIYRDENNYREALGWYKLAVQLNPNNQANRKKLDEMIDRVFQGSHNKEPQESTDDEQVQDTSKLVSFRQKVRANLEKITPIHIIFFIGGATILTFGLVWILASPSPREQQQPPAASVPVDSSPSPIVPYPGAQTPEVTQPAPDNVEVPPGNGGMSIPGLPGITMNPDNNTTGNDKSTSATPPSSGGNKPAAPSSAVPPFEPPQVRRMTAEEVELETQQIRDTLDAGLKNSKLPAAELNNVMLDPRSKTLLIEYTVPPMRTTTEIKQGLLYAGFSLVWGADKADSSIRSYILRGYAYTTEAKDTSLALQADVSPQQADAAREAGDYRTVARYLLNAWWRGDLENAEL